ncbi:MAG: DUF3750 domain-containing protein [Burkholderiaceae bacterium]|nr:DUF3750 domain-containing protein [Burkholderiaceae bacterium]
MLAQRIGPDVDGLIDRLEAAVAAYPYADRYRVWPGPNSNTFIAFMARALPELRVDLPANAIGKDYLAPGTWVDRLPSGTGWQWSAGGLLGASLGRVEGLELNLLGLSAGIDFNDLALPARARPGAPCADLGRRAGGICRSLQPHPAGARPWTCPNFVPSHRANGIRT